MQSKSATQSKVIWANVIALAIAVVTCLLDQELIKANPGLVQGFAMALAVLNIALRFLTVQPIRMVAILAPIAFAGAFFAEPAQSHAQWVSQRVCTQNGCYTVNRWVGPITYAAPRWTTRAVNPAIPQIELPRLRPILGPILIPPPPQTEILVPPPPQTEIIDFPDSAFVISPIDDLQTQAASAVAMERGFIKTLRKATTEARNAGKLTAMQQARILAAARLPRVGKEMEQLIAAEFELQAGATGLIDWENFDPEKFLALIEGILKILLIFGIGV